MKRNSQQYNDTLMHPTGSLQRMSSYIPSMIYVVSVFTFIKDHYSLFSFPLDDAWIHMVYSRSFAFGNGFSYNIGQQEAGLTSPLWSIVIAPAHWLSALGTETVVLAVKGIGIFFGLIAVLLIQRIAYRLTGSKFVAIFAASLFGLEPKLLYSIFSGMETILLVVLLMGACYMLMEKKRYPFMLLLGLAPLARPEAALLLPFALAGIVMIQKINERKITRFAYLGLSVLPSVAWACFCLSVTGRPFPNTYYMKAHSFSLGVSEIEVGLSSLLQYSFSSPWLMVVGLSAFTFLCFKKRMDALPLLIFFGVAPVLYLLAVVGSRVVDLGGYYWTRWLDPASLMIVAAVCIGCSYFVTYSCKATEGCVRKPLNLWPLNAKILISLISVFSLLSSLPTFADSYVERRNRLATDARAIDMMNVQLGKWIHDNTEEDAIVGINDAGAIRYFGKRHTIDLVGLNNADIAFGRIGIEQAIRSSDWLAIFPGWFRGTKAVPLIMKDFTSRTIIRIPQEEYTPCNCPDQIFAAAYQNKASSISN